MNNTEKIRKKCIEANEDIVALKFGCIVQLKNWSNAKRRIVREGDDWYMSSGDNYKEEEFEIIGRPITLPDVLLALALTKNPIHNVGYTVSGQFFMQFTNFQDDNLIWNLRDDNLKNQSEELKQFVADLL